jgi:osmotically-inducible protein OsmY
MKRFGMAPVRRGALLAALLATQLFAGCAPLMLGGAVVGGMMAADRRTSGAQLEDQSIELKATNRISAIVGERGHVNITSYNRMVLLTGEVPDDQVRRDVERIVRAVDNVRGVTNDLTIGAPTSLSNRANDSYITSKVKARFVDAQRFNAIHVKVVTENQTAYLIGLVKRQEAKDAIEIARTTEGVKKVVTVFEYLD